MNESTLYVDLDDSGRCFGCDSETPHMANRDGQEWSCRTCYELPVREVTPGLNVEIIPYGFDVCNECYPKVQHPHALEQGWRSKKLTDTEQERPNSVQPRNDLNT